LLPLQLLHLHPEPLRLPFLLGQQEVEVLGGVRALFLVEVALLFWLVDLRLGVLLVHGRQVKFLETVPALFFGEAGNLLVC